MPQSPLTCPLIPMREQFTTMEMTLSTSKASCQNPISSTRLMKGLCSPFTWVWGFMLVCCLLWRVTGGKLQDKNNKYGIVPCCHDNIMVVKPLLTPKSRTSYAETYQLKSIPSYLYNVVQEGPNCSWRIGGRK